MIVEAFLHFALYWVNLYLSDSNERMPILSTEFKFNLHGGFFTLSYVLLALILPDFTFFFSGVCQFFTFSIFFHIIKLLTVHISHNWSLKRHNP